MGMVDWMLKFPNHSSQRHDIPFPLSESVGRLEPMQRLMDCMAHSWHWITAYGAFTYIYIYIIRYIYVYIYIPTMLLRWWKCAEVVWCRWGRYSAGCSVALPFDTWDFFTVSWGKSMALADCWQWGKPEIHKKMLMDWLMAGGTETLLTLSHDSTIDLSSPEDHRLICRVLQDLGKPTGEILLLQSSFLSSKHKNFQPCVLCFLV